MPFVVGQRYRAGPAWGGVPVYGVREGDILTVAEVGGAAGFTANFIHQDGHPINGHWFFAERWFTGPLEDAEVAAADEAEPPDKFVIYNARSGRLFTGQSDQDGHTYARALGLAQGWLTTRPTVDAELHIIPLRSVTKVTRAGVEDYRTEAPNGG